MRMASSGIFVSGRLRRPFAQSNSTRLCGKAGTVPLGNSAGSISARQHRLELTLKKPRQGRAGQISFINMLSRRRRRRRVCTGFVLSGNQGLYRQVASRPSREKPRNSSPSSPRSSSMPRRRVINHRPKHEEVNLNVYTSHFILQTFSL